MATAVFWSETFVNFPKNYKNLLAHSLPVGTTRLRDIIPKNADNRDRELIQN